MAALSPWRGKERGEGGERDRSRAGEAGEPMHDLDEERVYHCEQRGSGWAALLETLERVDDRTGGPRMQVDML
eukprot:10192072-Prorocentrum_lima.AAC.1